MSGRLETIKNLVLFIASIIVGLLILNDYGAGVYKYMGLLPICHGISCLLFSHIGGNLAELFIKSFYFIRNVVTSFLMYRTDYFMPLFSPKSDRTFILSIVILSYETLCVFAYLRHLARKGKYVSPKGMEGPLLIRNTALFNLIFLGGLAVTVGIYFIVPQTHDLFMPIFEEDAALLMGVTSDEVSDVGGLNRILFTLFSILFSLYRLVLPAYLMTLFRKYIKNDFLGLSFCLLLLPVQFLFVTERTMSTLIDLLILVIYMMKLYPRHAKLLAFGLLSAGTVILSIFVSLKTGSDSAAEMLSSDMTLSVILQAYIPGVENMQGIFFMPKWNFSSLVSDIYSMIPFRNSLFGFDFGPTTCDIYREYNMARGQIIPLVGQSYYHFGLLFAPVLSLLLCKISIESFDKRDRAKNYLQYIFYVNLSISAGMTPCMYYFSIFGASLLTYFLVIYLLSKLL